MHNLPIPACISSLVVFIFMKIHAILCLISPQLQLVDAFLLIPAGNHLVGRQHTNRIDDHPKEVAGQQKFQENPNIPATPVPYLM